jgi:hypothetical protein
MLAFLDSVLALDDGECAKIAMLDCIMDSGSTGTNNWFSKRSELLTHVHGGTLPVDALHTDGSVNVDKCPNLWRKHQNSTVWGNLSTDPRTAPGDDVTLCTCHVCRANRSIYSTRTGGLPLAFGRLTSHTASSSA